MRIQSISSVNYVSNTKRTQKTSESTNVNFKRAWNEHISWGANYLKQTEKTNFKLFSFPDAKAVFLEVADKANANFGNLWERLFRFVAVSGTATMMKDTSIEDIQTYDDKSKIYKMENKGDGIFELNDVDAKPDKQYRFLVVNKDNNIFAVKDPYSKKQENILGWSTVYDKDNYEWKNTDWIEGKDSRRIIRKPDEKFRGLQNLRIDEVNIPTLTLEGTFESAFKKVDEIAQRGYITAIEIMPVENTFSPQWGYDGVDKFAVNEKLGGAKDLKALIDYAHGKGLNVIMDMVPNHIGPDGNFLEKTGPYTDGNNKFGSAINYEKENSKYSRDWITNAVLWWADEFKVDGVRLDMTPYTNSDYGLQKIIAEMNEHFPNVFTIAEDGRNRKELTTYGTSDNNLSHEEKMDIIDKNIEEYPNKKEKENIVINIGFDSEWNFELMHGILDLAVNNDNKMDNLKKLDDNMVDTQHKIIYATSHDEYGNHNGTRLVSKAMVEYLDMNNQMSDYDFANVNNLTETNELNNEKSNFRRRKAAHMSQELLEKILTDPNVDENTLVNIEGKYGCKRHYSIKELEDSIKVGLAKSRLAQGTVMTIPGPKMFFQGDDNAETAYFKFFREFSSDKENRKKDPSLKNAEIQTRGYDYLNEEAQAGCIVDVVKPQGKYENIQEQMVTYFKDLNKLADENPALREGDIVDRYKELNQPIHMHRVQKDDNDIIVLKNFSNHTFYQDCSLLGFPNDGKWVEILNSDDTKYGGGGNTNEGQIIEDLKQRFNFAGNSIIIMKNIKA